MTADFGPQPEGDSTMIYPGKAPRKAYSYLRFSTPEQMRGDSYRRQTQLAVEYAEEHGLELDDTLNLQDLGVSSYRGRNVKVGKLGEFLDAVDSGYVEPGSVLLIESFDRISRQAAWRGQHIVTGIISSGISIVTLSGRPREFSPEVLDRDPLALFEILFTLMRANDESATKARRMRAVWEAKRDRVAEGKERLTTICPNWIEYDPEKDEFNLIPERAEVVRRIYREYLSGNGMVKIAEILNAEGVPTFPNGKRKRAKYWHQTYIGRILRNPAAMGTLVTHQTRHVDGKRVNEEVARIPRYYPAAVDEQMFQDVQAMRSGGRSPRRGRHAHSEVRNLFGGLCKCGRCGGTVVRVDKGRGKVYLVCAKAKAGAGCTYESIPYQQVEDLFVKAAPKILHNAPLSPEGDDGISEDLDRIDTTLHGLSDAFDSLLEAYQETRSVGILDKIREIDAEKERLEEERKAVMEAREAHRGGLIESRINQLAEVLSEATDATGSEEELDRTRANALMRQVFKAVVLDYDTGYLACEFKQGGKAEVIVGWPKSR
ncbi:MAG TPA: recombinase family protein [Longimicrobiales bacterium]